VAVGALSIGGGADITIAALRAGRVARVGVAIATASIVLIYAAPIARAFTVVGQQHVKSLDALSQPNIRFPLLRVQARPTARTASNHGVRSTAATTPFFQTQRTPPVHRPVPASLRWRYNRSDMAAPTIPTSW
jgi:hypothetical protein